ncbi:MAG: UvrD-helicase domain-containing protein [Alphaproteobacteria bacterium GM202ARS2]|nr:UvrD-helicase domain-containing protein [Alphaproteobacteria bacterium GM202ARS2]
MSAVSHLLDTLNPPQQQVVCHHRGPLLVLSGAGTGKTKVLVHRVAHLIEQKKTDIQHILAVTFTNKAANEMKQRIQSLLRLNRLDNLWMGTFHAICHRILRIHADDIGLPKHFTIIDANEQIRIIKTILKEYPSDVASFEPKMIVNIIERWKNKGLHPEDLLHQGDHKPNTQKIQQVYEHYQKALNTYHAVDFSDLILRCVDLLQKNREILAKWQSRWTHILVDEYQDTNTIQYLWLRLLAQHNHNICCVGDDDQSIYGWRGAEVSNILRFEKDFPKAQIIRLEQNYRSTPEILTAATSVIQGNKQRLGKTLWTEKKSGDKIKVYEFYDSQIEANSLSQQVADALDSGYKPDSIAVLVRTSAQTRAIEESLNYYQLPYRVVGGMRFYERSEIRDVLAYWRFSLYLDDDLALIRIINTPKRGVGPKALDKLTALARQNQTSLFIGIETAVRDGHISGKAYQTLALFCQQARQWHTWLQTLPHQEAARQILEDSGYLALWHKNRDIVATSKQENIDELISTLKNYETMPQFIDHVSLLTQADQDEDTQRVSLMTLHSAKGLEFDVVFLPGWEEALFPHKIALEENGQHGLEEERRLAYVGITRARKRAVITYCTRRLMYNQWIPSQASRFIRELPEDVIEFITQTPSQARVLPPPPVKKLSSFHAGDSVEHTTYGNGVIRHVDGDRLDILFKSGAKKILSSYVKKL